MTSTAGNARATASTLPSFDALSTTTVLVRKPSVAPIVDSRQAISKSLVFQFAMMTTKSYDTSTAIEFASQIDLKVFNRSTSAKLQTSDGGRNPVQGTSRTNR